MSHQANERLIRTLTEEVWNSGNLDYVEALYAPDPMRRTLPELVSTVTSLRAALPDLRLTIDEAIATEDRVVTQWSITGTHRGHLRGLSGADLLQGRHMGEDLPLALTEIAPTGHKISISGVSIFHMSGGHVASSWGLIDRLDLLQQLRTLPSPSLVAV
jgi:predicted ester cyclase